MEIIGFAFIAILIIGVTFLFIGYILVANKLWSKSSILQSFEFRLKPASFIIVLISIFTFFGTIIYIVENYDIQFTTVAQIVGIPLMLIMGFFIIKDNTDLFKKR